MPTDDRKHPPNSGGLVRLSMVHPLDEMACIITKTTAKCSEQYQVRASSLYLVLVPSSLLSDPFVVSLCSALSAPGLIPDFLGRTWKGGGRVLLLSPFLPRMGLSRNSCICSKQAHSDPNPGHWEHHLSPLSLQPKGGNGLPLSSGSPRLPMFGFSASLSPV